MKISVLVPVRDDLEGLSVTLDSLAVVDTGDHEVEVIVCNDGGPQTVSDLARKFGCRVVELQVNCGSYAARNAGLQVATGDILAFVDADQRVDKGWLLAGVEAMDKADYIGGSIVIELPENPTAWHYYDRLAAFPLYYYLDRRHFAPTANLFVWRRVFEQIGCFEEALKSGGDREFGVRVHRADFKMAHCAQAITFHPARDFYEQATKVARVARGATELEYLVWKRPWTLVFRQALVALLKTPFRALGRIPGLAKPPVSGGDGWKARDHIMWGTLVIMYQWGRVRHLLQLLRMRKRDSWVSRTRALPESELKHHG